MQVSNVQNEFILVEFIVDFVHESVYSLDQLSNFCLFPSL